MPSMDDHIDPVNHIYFEGLHKEVSDIEYFLGLQPQGAFANVRARLDNLSQLSIIPLCTATVSPTGANAMFSSIQSAIDYVVAQGGGSVVLKSGTYTLSSQLASPLCNNIKICCIDGMAIITCSSALTHLASFNSAGANYSNIFFENIKFDGYVQTGSTDCILLLQTFQNVHVSNCYFYKGKGDQVHFYAISKLFISGCVFDSANADACFDDGNCSDMIYTNCNFINHIGGGYGIELVSAGSIISNCFFRSLSNGIYIEASYCNVHHNKFDTVAGIAINCNHAYNTIQGNVIYSNGGNAIQTYSPHLLITGNFLYSCNAIGFNITQGFTQITNNFIEGNVGDCIVSSNAYYLVISNNKIYDAHAKGIFLTTCIYSSIVGNVITKFVTQAISLINCPICTVTGNVVMENTPATSATRGLLLTALTGMGCQYVQVSGNCFQMLNGYYCIEEADVYCDCNNYIANVLKSSTAPQILLSGAGSKDADNMKSGF
jgi:hypothetical protein